MLFIDNKIVFSRDFRIPISYNDVIETRVYFELPVIILAIDIRTGIISTSCTPFRMLIGWEKGQVI
jgi:hypothetical protein